MSYTITKDGETLQVRATLTSEAEFVAFIDKLTKEYRDFFVPVETITMTTVNPHKDPQNTGC